MHYFIVLILFLGTVLYGSTITEIEALISSGKFTEASAALDQFKNDTETAESATYEAIISIGEMIETKIPNFFAENLNADLDWINLIFEIGDMPSESFTDINNNGFWDTHEYYVDRNSNGIRDSRDNYIDSNYNGQWDDAEPFNDFNNNGFYDIIGSFPDLVSREIILPYSISNGQYYWEYYPNSKIPTNDENTFLYENGFNYTLVEKSNDPYELKFDPSFLYSELINLNFGIVGEYFEDNNRNGQWDDAEPLITDFDNDGEWDDAEYFSDWNDNGQWDDAEPLITDFDNDGEWDDAEYVYDSNGNGVWDDAEPLITDFDNDGEWDDAEYFYDENGNGQWDASFLANETLQEYPADEFDDYNGNGVWDDAEPLITDFDNDGEWDDAEYLYDSNGNGVWDDAEPFDDLNGDELLNTIEPYIDSNLNGQWDPADTYSDLDNNGQWDDAEYFYDNEYDVYDEEYGHWVFVPGNGQWDDAEPLTIDYDGDGRWDNGETYSDTNGNQSYDLGEPFSDVNLNGQWDPGDTFTDLNGNGQWDDAEHFDDENGNGQWDDAEPLVNDYDGDGRWDNAETFNDYNNNGLRDIDGPETFTDIDGNGQWDDAESFNDRNGNGQWDDAETFSDLNGDGWWNEAEYLSYDENGNGQWDDAYTDHYQDYRSENFSDRNGNGQWDPAETFTDLNGNGQWDDAESFNDRNGNGQWDDAETFSDLNGDGWWNEEEYLSDNNGNGQWDPAETFNDLDDNGEWDAAEELYNDDGNGIFDGGNIISEDGSSIEEAVNDLFNFNEYFYFPINHNSSIQFQYIGTEAKQCNFEVSQDISSDLISDETIIYLNGHEIGWFNNSQYYLELLSNPGPHLFSSQIGPEDVWGIAHRAIIPLYLENGDIVSFNSEGQSDRYFSYYEDFNNDAIGTAVNNVMQSNYNNLEYFGVGIRPEIESDFTVLNGQHQEVTDPDFGEDFDSNSILDLIKLESAPFRDTARAIIQLLDNFSINDTVILESNFTGYDLDIVIGYADAKLIQGSLQLFDLFLGLSDQYDLTLTENEMRQLNDLLDNQDGDNLNFILNYFTNLLEILPEKASDHQDAQEEMLSALNNLKLAIENFTSREILTNEMTQTYLFEVSEDLFNQEEILDYIDSLVAASTGFINANSITNRQTSGFKYSILPFLNTTPFPIKEVISELEEYDDYDTDFTLRKLKEYEFIKEIFPSDFYGSKLVFYEDEKIIEIVNYDENFDFSPFTGELETWDSENTIIDDMSEVNLYRNDNYSGTWSSSDTINNDERSGTFFFYNALLDLNNNGTIDAYDDTDEYDSSFIISSEYIAEEVNNAHPSPETFTGFIQLYPSTSDYDDHYGEIDIDAYYYISNDDVISDDEDEYYNYSYADGIEILLNGYYNYPSGDYYEFDYYYEYEYEYDGRVHGKLEVGNSNEPWNDRIQRYNPGSLIYKFKDSYSGELWDGFRSIPFVMYPSYLDLDNDGIADGNGIIAGIEPEFSYLPSTYDIVDALNEYESGNQNSKNDEASINSNFIDDDNDGISDELENAWSAYTGASSENSNDGDLTHDFLLNTVYTHEQMIDLRPGSTIYELNQGLSSFNIILEQSTDLTTWTPYGEYSMELSDDGDSDIKFFRFKMAD